MCSPFSVVCGCQILCEKTRAINAKNANKSRASKHATARHLGPLQTCYYYYYYYYYFFFFFMPSVANVPEGLKYQKRMCRSGLGVGVKFYLLRKAAMKTNAVEALHSDGNSLKKKSCFSRFACSS